MEGCEFQVAEALLASCAELSSKTASDCACSSGGRGGGLENQLSTQDKMRRRDGSRPAVQAHGTHM